MNKSSASGDREGTFVGGPVPGGASGTTRPPPVPRGLERVPGPALVGLGAAGWGTEGLFRFRLDQRLAPYPIVLLEHLLQVVFTLPWLVRHLWLWRRIPKRAFYYVLLSGGIGSSLGTVCYTAALGSDVNPTAAAVLLNLQPVVSTLGAAVLFGERIRRRFYPWAALAIVAGVFMALPHLRLGELGSMGAGGGYVYVAGTIVLWGFATVAGRGAMRDLPLGLAAPLRLWAGLVTTGLVVGLRLLAGHTPPDLSALRLAIVWRDLLLLTTVSGAVPLFIYFAGLARTPAAIAGYCEMLYTITACFVAWLFLPNGSLAPHQAVAALVLLAAVVMLNRGASVADPLANRPSLAD